MTPTPPSLPRSLLTSFISFLFPGNQPPALTLNRRQSCVFPMLCSILFILYSYFYILYFYKSLLISMDEHVSHCHSGAVEFYLICILLFLFVGTV